MSFYPYFNQNGQDTQNILYLNQLADVDNALNPNSSDVLTYNGSEWDSGSASNFITITTIDTNQNINGLYISGPTLRLTAAGLTSGGALTTGAQQIAGVKSFVNGVQSDSLQSIGSTLSLSASVIQVPSFVSGILVSDNSGVISSTTQVNATQLQGVGITTTAPTLNQVLAYNGSEWAPATSSGSLPILTADKPIITDALGGITTADYSAYDSAYNIVMLGVPSLSYTSNSQNVFASGSNTVAFDSASDSSAIGCNNVAIGPTSGPPVLSSSLIASNNCSILAGTAVACIACESTSTGSVGKSQSCTLCSNTCGAMGDRDFVASSISGCIMSAATNSAVISCSNAQIEAGNQNVIIGSYNTNILSTAGDNNLMWACDGATITAGNNNFISGNNISNNASNAYLIGSNITNTGSNSTIFANNSVSVSNSQSNVVKFITNNAAVSDVDTSTQSSAILSLNSTSKGLLKPRMTTAQRTAIASPATGLEVYDTSLNLLYVYNGSAWVALTPSSTYNIIYRDASLFNTNFASATTAINSNFVSEFVFANAGTPYILWSELLNSFYSGGDITVVVYWYATATGAVVWNLGYSRQNSNTLINTTAAGTAVATSSSVLADEVNEAALTISGITLAAGAGSMLSLKLIRDAAAGGDTLTTQARVIGVKIMF